MVSQLLKINCQNKTRRVLLRVCGFTYPLWGVLSLTGMIYYGMLGIMNGMMNSVSAVSFEGGVNFSLAFGAVFISGICALYTLMRGNLTSDTGQNLSFPGFLTCNLPLANLLCITLIDDDLAFHFGDPQSKNDESKFEIAETFRISLSRISKADRLVLLHFIEENAPHCFVHPNVRRLFEEGEPAFKFDPAATVRVSYDNHSKLEAFYEVFRSHEKMFWKVWFLSFLPFVIYQIPIVCSLPFYWSAYKYDPVTSVDFPALSLWYQCWKPIIMLAQSLLNSGTQSVLQLVNNYLLFDWFFMVFGVFFLVRILNLLSKPNAILLSPWGIQFDPGHFGFHFDPLKLKWDACKKVEFLSAEGKNSLSKEQVVFRGEGDSSLATLDLKSLSQPGARMLLKDAIASWAPDAELDVRFIETVHVPRTYTELWLRSLNTPPKRDRLAPLKKGECLLEGGLRILQTLGAGGQGVAYLAEYADNAKKQVVIKEFILPVYVDRRIRVLALERFERESNVLKSLNHEHIVKLNDHFIEDHRAYLVLEHITGKSLRQLSSDAGGLSDQEFLCKLTRQMCDVLSYLHSQSPVVVHRDFAPDNLILDRHDKVKLIDFNVAHQAIAGAGNDAKVTVVGKRSYMPPEQFAGKPTTQSDIYALGATLYFMLSGRDPDPFTQTDIQDEFPSFHPLWRDIIMGCTALGLDERFKSCSEIIALLEHIEDSMPDKFVRLKAATMSAASTLSAVNALSTADTEPEKILLNLKEELA